MNSRVAAAALLVGLPLFAANLASAAPRVAVDDFDGPRGRETARRVKRVLIDLLDVTDPREADVVIRGRIAEVRSGWALLIQAFDVEDERVGKRAFPIESPRLRSSTVRRVARAIDKLARQAHRAPTRRRPPPRQRRRRDDDRQEPLELPPDDITLPPDDVETEPDDDRDRRRRSRRRESQRRRSDDHDAGDIRDMDDDQGNRRRRHQRTGQRADDRADERAADEDEVAPGVDDFLKSRREKDPSAKPAKKPKAQQPATAAEQDPGARPPWRTYFDIALGFVLVNRSFNFNDQVLPPDPRRYTTPGVAFAVNAEAALYPLAKLGRFAAGLGLNVRYFRIVGLSTLIRRTEEVAKTDSQALEIGFRYRYNLLNKWNSPVFRAGVDYATQSFSIRSDESPIPAIKFSSVKIAIIDMKWAFVRLGNFKFGVRAMFDYILVLSAGAIESSDTNGFGDSKSGGIDVQGGLFGEFKGFFVEARGMYRRYFMDFDQTCRDQGCNIAGGALDVYAGATINLGYSY